MRLWVARDSDGYLFLYDKKPSRGNNRFWGDDLRLFVCIPKEELPEVTWENSPLQVELKIVDEVELKVIDNG